MREIPRILIVEDDYLIATLLADVLQAAHWEVVGPVGRLAEAVETARVADFEAAVLDINLAGETVYPVAEALSARHIPFVFLTGYGAEAVARPFCGRPRLGKPFKTQDLIGTVARLVAPATEA